MSEKQDHPTEEFGARDDQQRTLTLGSAISEPTELLPTQSDDEDQKRTLTYESRVSEPTELLPTTADLLPTEVFEKDENDLEPSKVRFVLICILGIFIAIWLCINAFNVLSVTSSVGICAAWTNGVQNVIWVDERLGNSVQIRDQIVSIDGRPQNARYSFRLAVRQFGPDETHLFQLKNAEGPYFYSLVTNKVPLDVTVRNICLGIIVPAYFFL